MSGPTVEQWIAAMRAYPRDGWDGAAALIAAHDRRVRDLERQLDETMPGWRNGDLDGFRPRTRVSASDEEQRRGAS